MMKFLQQLSRNFVEKIQSRTIKYQRYSSSLSDTDCLLEHPSNSTQTSKKLYIKNDITNDSFEIPGPEQKYNELSVLMNTLTNFERPQKILITGGMGQLGRILTLALQALFGKNSVLTTDICKINNLSDFEKFGNSYRYLNVMDKESIHGITIEEGIDTIVHLPALLSAVAELNFESAMKINVQGVQNVLTIAREHNLKVFIPSTIGVYGENIPREMVPEFTIQRPNTIYGVTKLFAELLGEYFFTRFGLDFRCLRFPGVISADKPGGGTTDYAVQIFYDALLYGKHICYLKPDTMLPMMYEDDCVASVLLMLLSPSEQLSLRTYNVTGFSLSPHHLAQQIRRFLPGFEIKYEICTVRQGIADSWPQSLDDSKARLDFNWNPRFDLGATVEAMLFEVERNLISDGRLENVNNMEVPVKLSATA